MKRAGLDRALGRAVAVVLVSCAPARLALGQLTFPGGGDATGRTVNNCLCGMDPHRSRFCFENNTPCLLLTPCGPGGTCPADHRCLYDSCCAEGLPAKDVCVPTCGDEKVCTSPGTDSGGYCVPGFPDCPALNWPGLLGVLGGFVLAGSLILRRLGPPSLNPPGSRPSGR